MSTNTTTISKVTGLQSALDLCAKLAVAQTFTAAQRVASTALTDGATITINLGLTNDYTVTLGGNRTLANPTGIVVGQKGTITVTQDGTGNRTLAFGAYWKWENGIVGELSTTGGSVDRIDYHVISSTAIHVKISKAFV